MPIREYLCPAGHKTEKLVFGDPPQEKPCPECERLVVDEPMFHSEVLTATMVYISKPWTPSDDYKKAETRARYKGEAQEARR